MKNNSIILWISLVGLYLFNYNLLNAQCNKEGHSTNEKDSWLSCQISPNPNTTRGDSHWLQYDLGYIYQLGTTTFWNYNAATLTGRGFKQIAIDYSLDGEVWTTAGTFQLPEAEGDAGYEGMLGLDLTGITARYVLITALSNWNGGACAGLSEVRLEVSTPNGACGDFLVSENIGDSTIDAGIHYSNSVIESDGVIKNGTTVTFQSAMSITLNPEFTVEAGAQFLATIATCTTVKKESDAPPSQARQALQLIDNKREIEAIKVYPNPVVHLLTIDVGKIEITDLTIINVSGHEILRRTGQQNLSQIEVSKLPSGMYLLTILTKDHQVITRRFIKARL